MRALEPELCVFLTLLAYEAGRRARDRTGHPLAQPALVAIVGCATTTAVLGIPYAEYRSATALISFWLGPATVALAIPLHRQRHLLRGIGAPLTAALSLGAIVSVTSGAGIVELLGGSHVLARTMAPKAATAPVSLALSARIGGVPALSAVLTIVIGVVGAVFGPWTLDRLRIHDRRARGVALGAVSHGIGTSRALQEHDVEGAFAGLSMGLTAVITCVVAPLLAHVLT